MQFLVSSTEDILRWLCAWICEWLYTLIAGLYDLFINISRVEILKSEQIQPIYQRITMILAIVMVFYVTFEAVKFVIQPDQFTDKEKGAPKIVLKMVMVVIFIAFVPTIFSGAYWVQNKIFDTQVFSKVILGQTNINNDQLGKNLAYNVFNMFYYADTESFTKEQLENDKKCEGIPCQQVVTINLYNLQQYGHMNLLQMGLNETGKVKEETTGEKVEKYYIFFNGLFAVCVGLFIAYMLLMYCVDAGVRVVQMLFLQIIAPIPIMGYLSPKKDGIFEKWLKQCITTYLDLFLRVGIIHFVLLICQILGDAFADGSLFAHIGGGTTGLMKMFMYIAIIMGLLLFAHKAPKMLGELFPSSGAASGNFGLKAKDRYEPTWNALKGTARVAGAAAGTAIGGVAGAIQGAYQGSRRSKSLNKDGKAKGFGAGAWGATKGALRGFAGGATRGLYNGAKKGNVFKNSMEGAKKQFEANQKFGNREENGYTLGHQIEDRFRGAFNAKSRIQAQEEAKAPIKRHDDALKRVADTESNIKKRALEKIKEGGAKSDEARAAAQELAVAETELKALEDPATAKSKYKVGKYTDDSEAQKAYNDAVLLAKSSVNKSNFIDESGNFDKASYDAACQAAASQIKAEDYAVAYKTDADAQAAYQNAVNKAKASVDRTAFTTEADYNAACQAAADGVNRDLYIQGYETEEAAQEALGKAIDNARSTLDDKQKAAVAAYAKQTGDNADAAIGTMVKELETYVTEYNNSASSERKVVVDYNGITKDFKAFSDTVKKGDIRKSIDKNSQETIKIDAEIDKIKRETEGSGINEGKKS